MGILDWFRSSRPAPEPALYGADGRKRLLLNAAGESVDGMAMPQIFSFANLVQGANRTYMHNYADEARRHDRENAKAMWRDPFLKGLLNERKRGVMGCKWHLEPDNALDPWQQAAAEALTKILKNIPRWRRIRWQLLNAIWFGKYAVQVDWHYKYMDLKFPAINGPAVPGMRPQMQTKRCRVLTVRKTKPKNGDSIGWAHDDTPYIQVYAGWNHPGAEIISVGGEGQGLLLRGSWRNRFVIHQHECEDAEYFDGDQAARHLGIGIRDELYWFDFLRRDYMEWVTKTLQRWGLGIIYIEYDFGNPASKKEALEAAKKYSPGKSVLTVPRSWEPGRTSEGIKILEIPVAGMDLLSMLRDKAEKVMERFVIGQHMSGGADNEDGLGGTGRANFARNTKSEVIEDDAENLAETLTGSEYEPGFVNQIFKHTMEIPAGFDFPCPRLVFQTEEIDVGQKLDAITRAAVYVPFKTDSLYDAVGEPRPEEGDETFGGPQPMAGAPIPRAPIPGGLGSPSEGDKDASGGRPQAKTGPYDSLFDGLQYSAAVPEASEVAEKPTSTNVVPKRPSVSPAASTSADVAPHIEAAAKLASSRFHPEKTPTAMKNWLTGMEQNPQITNDHLHAIADHFGSTTRHLKDKQKILYRIGEAMRDKSLEAAKGPVERATGMSQFDEHKTSTNLEDVFFGAYWPGMLSKTGMLNPASEAGIQKAATSASQEVRQFLKKNPHYADYYNKDWEETKSALEGHLGRPIKPDELKFFRLAAGLLSPGTDLPQNIKEAVGLFDHWKDRQHLDEFKQGPKPGTGNLVNLEMPVPVAGPTGANKVRSLKVVDALSKKLGGIGKAVDYLQEMVTPQELQAFNREMGYRSPVDIGSAKRIVADATGQSDKIPRMFVFGPKLGAYTLNSLGDSRFTTIDVWEARFIRSYFKGMFKNNTGITAGADEHKLFTKFASKFNEEFNRSYGKQFGKSLDPAAMQAARWFYMIDSVRKAGYNRARTQDTISSYAKKSIAELRAKRAANQPK